MRVVLVGRGKGMEREEIYRRDFFEFVSPIRMRLRKVNEDGDVSCLEKRGIPPLVHDRRPESQSRKTGDRGSGQGKCLKRGCQSRGGN